jgi:hypothetical protein
MAEPKAKTLVQQMGFIDKDLDTPDHDALMAKFIAPGAVRAFVTAVVPGITSERFLRCRYKPELEKAVVARESKSGFIVGFLDVYIEYETANSVHTHPSHNAGMYDYSGGKDREIFGPHLCWNRRRLFIELKAREKPNAGQLLRQLEVYKKHLGYYGNDVWVVACIGEYPNRELLIHSGAIVVEFRPDLKAFKVFQ